MATVEYIRRTSCTQALRPEAMIKLAVCSERWILFLIPVVSIRAAVFTCRVTTNSECELKVASYECMHTSQAIS